MNIKKKLPGEDSSREAVIVRTSVLGIVANLFLASFKAAVGILSRSIAVTLDAVNNLSDAASSIITIVGTKLAGKEPDRKHPFGHGRVEYLTSMLISTLVLYAGLTSLVQSVKKILRPDTPDYTAPGLLIIAVAVLVKFLLGRYVKAVGQRVDSDSLINSGEDASMDSLISASTLVAAAVYLLFHVSLEAWLGAVISLVIVKSGVEMLREGISRILGERASPELARAIRETVCEFPAVSGMYDLVLHDYGPDTFQGSMHIEVPDTCPAEYLDELIRNITATVYQKHHVYLTAVGVYSLNTHDPDAVEMRETLKKAVLACPYMLQMHGFYLNKAEKTVRFDAVISFDAPDRKAAYQTVYRTAEALYPDYTFQIAMDTDFSYS
ncbi:MAG: cation transporter [Oscillibacter sp.]|nr:cation transporter [Oscillibacter sp.]